MGYGCMVWGVEALDHNEDELDAQSPMGGPKKTPPSTACRFDCVMLMCARTVEAIPISAKSVMIVNYDVPIPSFK